MTGIRLEIGWHPGCATTFAPQGFASAGLGSCTSPTLREMVGRMLSSTVSFSLICGTTDMRKPTGTELTVVVNVVSAVVWLVVVCACTVKYTRLSTTFSTAVWLLSTLTFGLDSTRTSPKDSRNFSAKLKLRLA